MLTMIVFSILLAQARRKVSLNYLTHLSHFY